MNIVAKKHGVMLACPEKGQKIFSRAIERFKELPQVDVETEHHLYAGVYSRTIHMAPGVLIIGCELQCASQLVLCGKGFLTAGNGTVEVNGYHVLEGQSGRQCAVLATEDTWMTMFFATKATSIEEAEREFCSDPKQLLTNQEEKQICRE